MIAVADTSPLNYLVLIDKIDLLPAMFQTILVPQAVLQELSHPRTSAKVRRWMDRVPAWLEVRAVASIEKHALMHLDPGERQ